MGRFECTKDAKMNVVKNSILIVFLLSIIGCYNQRLDYYIKTVPPPESHIASVALIQENWDNFWISGITYRALITELMDVGFKVVEMENLDIILDEQKRQYSGLVEENAELVGETGFLNKTSIARIGKMLGVDYLIPVYVIPTGRKVNIDGKIGRQIINNYLNHLGGGSGPACSAATYKTNINNWIDHCDEIGNGEGICDYQDLVLMPGNDRHFWTICENYGDGHCFYWTLLRHFQSTGTHEDITDIGHNLDAVAEIRMRILAELQRRREVGLAQNPPRNAVSEETVNRQQEGIQDAFNGEYTAAWAEANDISAASQVFNLCIGVWNPEFSMWTFTRSEESDGTAISIERDGVCDYPNLLFTVNTNSNHFDTLLPKNPEEAAENAQQIHAIVSL